MRDPAVIERQLLRRQSLQAVDETGRSDRGIEYQVIDIVDDDAAVCLSIADHVEDSFVVADPKKHQDRSGLNPGAMQC